MLIASNRRRRSFAAHVDAQQSLLRKTLHQKCIIARRA
jgi:hypothetical protein